MMCLSPINIQIDHPNTYRWLRGERGAHWVTAPCGHCLECLQKKQNDLASRIYQESKTKSRMYFVTFTYAPAFEPYAGTLWRCDTDTGELRRLTEPVLLSDTSKFYSSVSDYFGSLSIPNSGVTRIFEQFLSLDDLVALEDSNLQVYYDQPNSLLLRVTPSLNIRHPRLAIKRWRVQYERDYGSKLPEFSYCLVGEFGTKRTRRPHYHMVILSNEMEKWQVELLTKEWHYGRTQIDIVPHFNKNGSDAFSAISRYIGKYVSKGPFDVDSAKEGLVKGSRICTSIHLGQTLTDREIRYFTCQDIKRFDQNWAFKELSEEDQKIILPEVIRRLYYKIETKKGRTLLFSMPHSLKKQIFNYHVDKSTKEATYSSLYYMVADFARSRYLERSEAEFELFRASRPPGEAYSKTVSLFEEFREIDKSNRKKILSEGLRSWYCNHSKF